MFVSIALFLIKRKRLYKNLKKKFHTKDVPNKRYPEIWCRM